MIYEQLQNYKFSREPTAQKRVSTRSSPIPVDLPRSSESFSVCHCPCRLTLPSVTSVLFFFLLSSFCCLVALVLLQRFSFDSIGGKKQLRPPFYYIYNQFEIWSKFLKSLYGFMSFHGLLLKRSE